MISLILYLLRSSCKQTALTLIRCCIMHHLHWVCNACTCPQIRFRSERSARLFANDTSLSYSSRNLQNLQLIINDDLKHLHEWARRWLITFNPSKTEVLLISNTFIDFDMQLVMDNSVLKIVDMHKHLGVTLSSNNKWNKHVELIIKSASKQVSYLRKAKYQFSKEILSKLYCTFNLC